jgi:hypothetical protein
MVSLTGASGSERRAFEPGRYPSVCLVYRTSAKAEPITARIATVIANTRSGETASPLPPDCVGF